MKAVNMKNYYFGNEGGFLHYYIGFGMYDDETDTFVSLDGRNPYVLRTKKVIQGCIDAGYAESFPCRVKPLYHKERQKTV